MTPTNPTTINDTDVGEVAADLPNVGRGALGAAGLAGVAYTLCMFFTSPDYISILWHDKLGNIMLIGSGIWMIIGVLVMRKMINFDY